MISMQLNIQFCRQVTIIVRENWQEVWIRTEFCAVAERDGSSEVVGSFIKLAASCVMKSSGVWAIHGLIPFMVVDKTLHSLNNCQHGANDHD